jgi:YbbR domain-containing protein
MRRPDSLAVAGQPERRALVLFRGRGKELLKLNLQGPSIEVDLSEASAGRFYHSLSVADVRMPANSAATPVAVVEPRLMTIELDRIQTRRLPVVLRFTGELPAGYLLRASRVEPDAVTLRGPSRLLARSQSLEVGPIDLRGFRGPAQGLFPVRVPSSELHALPAQVSVELEVERQATREVDGVAVSVLADASLVAIAEPAAAAVRLSGLHDRTAALEASDLRIVVDARGLGLGEHELPGRVDTVGGVLVTPVPERIRVRVLEQESQEPQEESAGEGG